MKWKLVAIDQFSGFQSEWDTLNREFPNSILLDYRFISASVRNFDFDNAHLAICEDQGKVIAVTIVSKVAFGRWSTIQPSQCPVAPWIHNDDYSLEDLLGSLIKCLPDFIVLNFGLTQQDPFLTRKPIDSGKISTLDYIQTARVTTENLDFDQYWAQRGRNLRQNINKQRNRLNRENVSLNVSAYNTPEQMEQCVDDYGKLESSGWKAEMGTAISVDNSQGRFYIDILTRLAETGNARVYQLHYNDKLVATDLCVSDSKQIIILKTTYDESESSSSPALLMRRHYFEDIFNTSEFQRIEFYGKVMEWHKKWTTDIRQMYHVNYFPHAFVKLLKGK
ncbi:MAG: GNAT family N-acetyltransferase [Gammaproteobacteria bacterium]|nr:GNAT family N-acetyltransferase [Gammaproteobacteria bacterium]